MKFKSFAICLLVMISVLSAQSLDQVVQHSLKNNLSLKIEKHAVQELGLLAESVVAKNLPTINFDASYRHVTDVAEIDFSAVPVMFFSICCFT